MLKEFLSKKGIAFEDHDVSLDSLAAQEVMTKTGQNGVPVTFINGQVVIGFDQPRLEQLLAQSRPEKLLFGASIADSASRQQSPKILGAYIGKVKTDSLAEKAGLTPGDIIIQLNLERIAGAADFEKAFSGLKATNKLTLIYIRNNSVLTSEITL